MIQSNNYHGSDIINRNFTVIKKKKLQELGAWGPLSTMSVIEQLIFATILDFAVCKKHNMHR